MASYLLLRDNKETGPFSLEELVQSGLKPYDLVWIENKSAAWRYPSEVNELKAFAPVVEEQPFDRFFKKEIGVSNDDTKDQNIFKKTEEAQHIQEKHKSFQQISEQHQKHIPSSVINSTIKRSVFVTLPAGRTVQVNKPQTQNSKPTTVVPKVVENSQNPITAEVKYEQPLNDIKEMYVKTLQDRKDKIARKETGIKYLKVAAVVAGLIIIGIAVRTTMNNQSSKMANLPNVIAAKQSLANAPSIDQNISSQTELAKIDEASAPNHSENSLKNESHSAANNNAVNEPQIQVKHSTAAHSSNKNSEIKDKTIKEVLASAPVKFQSSETTEQGERVAKTRHDNITFKPLPEDLNSKPIPKKTGLNLESKVKVTTNDYQRVAFGGIRNLQLTVTNDSKYNLDNVMVELQYIRPNEMTLKTENILFRSVGANNSATIKIPDTNRGIKVVYKIIHVESKQLNEETIASTN